MTTTKLSIYWMVFSISLLFSCRVAAQRAVAPASQKTVAAKKEILENGFRMPPVIARPKALWPWVNGNFSLSQITYEMEQAKLKGMSGVDIWDVGTTINEKKLVPYGPSF